MRLLSKKEIQDKQRSEKQSEIAEGLKLARKIDSLREASLSEQSKLEKFRNESISSLQTELGTLQGQKDALSSEVKVLRAEKERGLTILAQKEEELSKKEQELDDREEKSFLHQKEAEKIFLHAQSELFNAQGEMARLETHTKEAERLHILANNDRIEAQNALKSAQEEKLATKNECQRDELWIARKKDELKDRENALDKRAKDIEKQEKNIEKEWIRIADQRATLERAMKRIK